MLGGKVIGLGGHAGSFPLGNALCGVPAQPIIAPTARIGTEAVPYTPHLPSFFRASKSAGTAAAIRGADDGRLWSVAAAARIVLAARGKYSGFCCARAER